VSTDAIIPKLFVLCGPGQFDGWCRDNNIHPQDKRVVRLREPYQLAGVSDPLVLRYGTFKHNRRYHEIEQMIKRRGLRDRKSNILQSANQSAEQNPLNSVIM
jgi:hypothetical protein